MLISSWFYSLTFNLFKKMIYDTNDRLKFTLQEENRLLMIEEGYEDAQNNKEDVEVDYSRDSVAPRPRFSLLSASSL